jgi:hypothetical protein
MTTIAARARALLAAWRAELHRSYVTPGTVSTYSDEDVARDIAELDEVIAELATAATQQGPEAERGEVQALPHPGSPEASRHDGETHASANPTAERTAMTNYQPTWPAELLAYIDGIRERFGDAARVEADDYLKASLPTSKWARFLSDSPQPAEQRKPE